jgi:serine/threonine protein kinase/nucleoside phosphorylase
MGRQQTDYWLEIDLAQVGSEIRVAARGSGGEQPRPHLVRPEIVNSLLVFGEDVRHAASQGTPWERATRGTDVSSTLFKEVFREEVLEVLHRLQGQAREQPVLVKLILADPLLQSIPWEALYRPGTSQGSLGTLADLRVCRGGHYTVSWQPREVDGAVRLLAISPSHEDTPRWLRSALHPSIQAGEIEWLEPLAGERARLGFVLDRLRRPPFPHILHFTGHGGVDEAGAPLLRMADSDGGETWLKVQLLAHELHDAFRQNLRLVTLESCGGARPEALASAAELLTQMGAHAVMAHLWQLKADAARRCSSAFYRSLTRAAASSGDVVRSLHDARRSLLAEFQDSAEAFSPVLYLRGRDAVLFDFDARRTQPPAPAGSAPTPQAPPPSTTPPAARPLPQYSDPESQQLSEQIAEARERKRRLQKLGSSTTGAIDQEILVLRRQLREGGQLREGDSLGDERYLLLRRIGRGGFATVWEAHDEQQNQRVAIKVLHSELARDQTRRERFFRGARVMTELADDSIVHVLVPQGQDGGFHYYVMEFVPGGDLREAVLSGKLSGLAVLPIILRVGAALARAHEKRFIHRDIKPENILLDAAGTPRLTDFDLVGGLDTTGGTRTGALGSFLYAAPELMQRPQEADARADVYGLGMTALFGLSGREFTLDIIQDTEKKKLIRQLPCGLAVKKVIAQAVSRTYSVRFANAGEFCKALEEALTFKNDDPSRPPTKPARKKATVLMPRMDLLHKIAVQYESLIETNLLRSRQSPPPTDKIQWSDRSAEFGFPVPVSAEVTLGIITALPTEYVAMKALLNDCQDFHVPGSGAGRQYVLGKIPSRYGSEHRVALALADMGNNIASARATLLLEHFPAVDALLMVGIAGAVPFPQKPEDHVRLGDVVVSDKRGVVQYDMVKLKEVRACPIPPSARLLQAVRLLQADELEGIRPWDRHIDAVLKHLNQKRPPQAADKLHATGNPRALLEHPKDPKRLNRKPRVFLGPVASANEWLKDPSKRDSLREKFGVKAVEMEGSGIADATWNHDKGYLVIRGTCDYCDAHKNDNWQQYAAAVAAGYARALIESIFAPAP